MTLSKGKENLLILGATGYIGAYITEEIIKAEDNFGKIAIFTSPKTAETKTNLLDGWKAQGLEVLIGDVTKSQELLKAFEGLDPAYSA
jgi:FlaA1/EpsC-like NDP-sugar epimerase